MSDLEARARAIQGSPAYNDRNHPEHQRAPATVLELYQRSCAPPRAHARPGNSDELLRQATRIQGSTAYTTPNHPDRAVAASAVERIFRTVYGDTPAPVGR